MTTEKIKKELVCKSNRLVEASYRLNLVEQLIILYSIVKCRDEQKGLSPDKPVTIIASEFAAQFGQNSAMVYEQLKEAISSLYIRDVQIKDVHPATGKPRVINTRWISNKAYIEGAGQVEITFAPLMIPFIMRLGEDGNFTSYRLEKIANMSSIHAVRLYELLVQYLSIGKRSIELSWLKTIWAIDKEYTRIFDLKRWVIDVAVAQINAHSDIRVQYTQRKTGRTVTHFDFEIKQVHEQKAKKVNLKQNDKILSKDYIVANALPGETWEQATERLKAKASIA